MTVTRKCRRCHGSGAEPISKQLLVTLTALKRRGEASAGQLANNGVGPTAIINRLEDLRQLGFVDRRKIGRTWKYFIA